MRLGPFKSQLGTPRAGSTVPGSANWESQRCSDLQASVPEVPRPTRRLLPGAAWPRRGENEPHLPRQRPPQQGGAERAPAGDLGPRHPPRVGCALFTPLLARDGLYFLPRLARGGLCSVHRAWDSAAGQRVGSSTPAPLPPLHC